MKVGSLFSGIGAGDLGLERAGMQIEWQVEKDDWCRRVLAKHWPDVPKFGDIQDCGVHNLPTVDLVSGGFPCQPFSMAGQRRGADDDRYLWPEMARIVAELRPRWVLAENVFGLLSMVEFTSLLAVDAGGCAIGEVGDLVHRSGRGVTDQILETLESLGYSVQTLVIPACAVDAPHRRDRVWIVAHLDAVRCDLREPDGQGVQRPNQALDETDTGATAMAHAGGVEGVQRCNATSQWRRAGETEQAGMGCGDVAHAEGESTKWSTEQREELYPWEPEPGVGRVVDGAAHRVDRLRGLGNAQVPQVVEAIGRMILAAESSDGGESRDR